MLISGERSGGGRDIDGLMEQENVSVIIPMYNAEPYIRRCLQSLLDQTYRNWEAIVIDDGSTDRGADICREFAAADSRIRVFSQENGGVSAARNRGLDIAQGEYLFFLDSDDAIHPLLLEEMILQSRRTGADFLACAQAKLKPELVDPALSAASVRDERPVWEAPPREESPGLMRKYARFISGAGGKMIRRSAVGELRFREDLFLGEDTYFVNQLFYHFVQVAFTLQEWYYYSRFPESLTNSSNLYTNPRYYTVYHLLQEYDLAAGDEHAVQMWELELLKRLQSNYILQCQAKDAAGMAAIRKIAAAECRQPIFLELPRDVRLPFRWFFFNYPCYQIYRMVSSLRKYLRRVWRYSRRCLHRGIWFVKRCLRRGIWFVKRCLYSGIWLCKYCLYSGIWHLRYLRALMEGGADDMTHKIGILTFHCSDNFGAMLQAYGLKSYLCQAGLDAAIVSYSPPYMTGRHWYIPYVPYSGKGGFLRLGKSALAGWYRNRAMGPDFFHRRDNMRRFRRQYLTRGRLPRFFTWQLSLLPIRCFVVGSDQIWNPDITLGLRRAYFGAFPNPCKKRVVAYAASLGSAALPERYDQEFSALLRHVDAVSVREAEAVPYLEKFRDDAVTAVLDPVFLIGREDWQRVERPPEREGFILLYATERDPALYDYARSLSQEKDLPVVQLEAAGGAGEEGFVVDRAAGPSEFLGYLHHADYVVTNSFHAAAFSIIYQKRFLVFLHSTLGARTRGVLHVHGLEDRLYQEGAEIDAPIDWEAVQARSQENAALSKEFIRAQIY